MPHEILTPDSFHALPNLVRAVEIPRSPRSVLNYICGCHTSDAGIRAKTLKLPAAILYLLPWALAHSENLDDLDHAIEVVDFSITAYPNFKLFEDRNKPAIEHHRQVPKKSGRYLQRNYGFGRANTPAEQKWLDDKENLPIRAGGQGASNQTLT